MKFPTMIVIIVKMGIERWESIPGLELFAGNPRVVGKLKRLTGGKIHLSGNGYTNTHSGGIVFNPPKPTSGKKNGALVSYETLTDLEHKDLKTVEMSSILADATMPLKHNIFLKGHGENKQTTQVNFKEPKL